MYGTYEYYTKTCRCSKTNMNNYQFALQIEVTCGGIKPKFLKQKFCPLQHKLFSKKQKPPQHPKFKSQK